MYLSHQVTFTLQVTSPKYSQTQFGFKFHPQPTTAENNNSPSTGTWRAAWRGPLPSRTAQSWTHPGPGCWRCRTRTRTWPTAAVPAPPRPGPSSSGAAAAAGLRSATSCPGTPWGTGWTPLHMPDILFRKKKRRQKSEVRIATAKWRRGVGYRSFAFAASPVADRSSIRTVDGCWCWQSPEFASRRSPTRKPGKGGKRASISLGIVKRTGLLFLCFEKKRWK